MAKYVRKGSKGGKSGRPYVRRSRKATAKGNFKKRVLDVMRSVVETKQAFHQNALTNFNSGISGAGDCLQVIPSIASGTLDNQRVGDQIRPQSLSIRGIINMVPQDPTQSLGVRRIGVRVMVVSVKAYPTYAVAAANTATWMPGLLKKGGTTTSFAGALDDLYAPINTDLITCHYNKVFFLNQAMYYAGTTNVSTTYESGGMTKFFKKTFRFKNKVWKYDSAISGGLSPTNAGHCLLLGYVFLDGTGADVVTTRVSSQTDMILNYEDA